MTSKIIESVRGDLAALHAAGIVGKVTMRQFDAICPPPVRDFTAVDIKQLRESLRFSQPVFAHHLTPPHPLFENGSREKAGLPGLH